MDRMPAAIVVADKYFSLAARVLLDQGVLVVDRSHSRRDQGLAKAYFGLSLIRL